MVGGPRAAEPQKRRRGPTAFCGPLRILHNNNGPLRGLFGKMVGLFGVYLDFYDMRPHFIGFLAALDDFYWDFAEEAHAILGFCRRGPQKPTKKPKRTIKQCGPLRANQNGGVGSTHSHRLASNPILFLMTPSFRLAVLICLELKPSSSACSMMSLYGTGLPADSNSRRNFRASL